MKLSELKKIIDYQLKEFPEYDYEMRIEVNEHGFGPTPSVDVKCANFGFDWDSGSFIITPSQPLIKDTEELKNARLEAEKNRDREWIKEFNKENDIFDIDDTDDFDLRNK